VERAVSRDLEVYDGSIRTISKNIIGLRPIERIQLVEAILYSLGKPDPDIQKSWVALAKKIVIKFLLNPYQSWLNRKHYKRLFLTYRRNIDTVSISCKAMIDKG
jgi:hypothetical protein